MKDGPCLSRDSFGVHAKGVILFAVQLGIGMGYADGTFVSEATISESFWPSGIYGDLVMG